MKCLCFWNDEIFAENFTYADSSVCFYLTNLFHGFDAWNSTGMQANAYVPICKNTNGDRSDAFNYNAVSLATTISEFFEHHTLSYMSPFVANIGNQLGFKPQPDTDLYVFLLRLYHIT